MLGKSSEKLKNWSSIRANKKRNFARRIERKLKNRSSFRAKKIKEKENAFMKNRSQNFGDRFSFQRINKQEFLAINVENFEISAHFSADKKKVFYSSFRAEN